MKRSKNILAIGAHPDDVEFGCGGALLLLKELGYKINIVDLTRGEKASRGADKRIEEAQRASEILGIPRKVYNLGDQQILLTNKCKQDIEKIIGKDNPDIIFAPYFIDKHLDHANVGKLVSSFPRVIHYFISDIKNENLGVDITKVYQTKIDALNVHKSQIRFNDMCLAENRFKKYGNKLGVEWGELFYVKNDIELPDIFKKL